MNDLHVFDVSPMVYVGDCGSNTTYYGYPVGGIQFVLSHLAVAFAQYDQVILCFDSPSFRKQLSNSSGYAYKGGRERRPQVYSQIETLYEGLQKCGIRCEKVPRYEADDLVEWAVDDNAKDYYGITIYSNDYDLCHSIRDNTKLYTVSSAMSNVSPSRFENVIKKGEKIPYNTISAYKVFMGCNSDNIPALKLECGIPARKLYQSWLQAVGKVGPLYNRAIGANPAMVKVFAEKSGVFTQKEIADVEARIRLIYPAQKPEGVRIDPVYWKEVDKEAFTKLCSLYNAQKALNCLELRRYKLTETDKQDLQSKGRMLQTGEYAADKDLLFDRRNVRSSVLNLSSFEKEF